MAYEHSIRRYRHWYAKLLRLFSKPYYERFGEGMQQTFNDLLREHADEERGLFGCALWMFVDTSAGITRENIPLIFMINKRIIGIVLGTGLILLIPLVAMQFTNEVNWTLFDFVFAGTLLLGTGLTYELVARKASDIVYRAAVGIAVVTALLLVWINGAVGIIGDEGNPANLMYFGVLAVGFIGAIIARLEPRGMARALFAMALAQALVPVIALIIWKPSMEEVPGVFGVFTLNSFFVGLFVLSGFLFRHAARYPQELSNKENKMQVNFMISNIISWIFGIAFITIGVLNLFLVHPVPGVFYLLLSLVYFPLANVILKKRFGFSIPPAVKIILGLVVLWGTLAVGDLAEIFGL